MLTVKHQTIHGNEALYEATNVNFCPIEGAHHSTGPVRSATDKLGVLYMRLPNQSLEELSDGMVYVMNAAGSTVGKYDLGGWSADQANAARGTVQI